jgi:hypothetical protein
VQLPRELSQSDTLPKLADPETKVRSANSGPLTEDELAALLEFFLVLDEWDRKKKIA